MEDPQFVILEHNVKVENVQNFKFQMVKQILIFVIFAFQLTTKMSQIMGKISMEIVILKPNIVQIHYLAVNQNYHMVKFVKINIGANLDYAKMSLVPVNKQQIV